MSIEYAGLVAAAATFGGVWFGHVAVRRIEFASRRLEGPKIAFVLAGLSCEALSLSSGGFAVSAFFGIVGATLVYDAFELRRQWGRVLKGHAMANTRNSRHLEALATRKALLSDPLAGRAPIPVYRDREPVPRTPASRVEAR